MSNRLSRADVMVLLRVAGALTLVWGGAGLLAVPRLWEDAKLQRAYAAAGMTPAGDARWS
jgi:hypothetical protein